MAEARGKELGFYLSGSSNNYNFQDPTSTNADPVKIAKTFLFQNAFKKAMNMIKRIWKLEMQYHIFMKAIESAKGNKSLFFDILSTKIDIVEDVGIYLCENALSREINSLRAYFRDY